MEVTSSINEQLIYPNPGDFTMLEQLRSFIDRISLSKAMNMTRLTSYLVSVENSTTDLIARNSQFTANPVPTKGIDYLDSLISRADIDYILRADNDLDRLTRVSKEYKSATYSDFIRQYTMRSKSFISSGVLDTAEYLLITEDFDLIDKIPFGVDDISVWKNSIRPVMMISNPSTEILLNNVSSRLKYKSSPPVEAVFSINVIKLLMLYSKYRILSANEFIERVDNYPFIYDTCVLPMLYDNMRTLMISVVHNMISGYLSIENYSFDIATILYGEKSVFIHSGLEQAIHDIDDMIKKCSNKQIKPDVLLLSIHTSPSTSLYDEMISLMDNHYVGNGGVQYEWAEFIREYQLLLVFLGIYELYGESSRLTELRRLFRIMAKRAKNTKFWQHIRNPFVADGMMTRFEELCVLYDVS